MYITVYTQYMHIYALYFPLFLLIYVCVPRSLQNLTLKFSLKQYFILMELLKSKKPNKICYKKNMYLINFEYALDYL